METKICNRCNQEKPLDRFKQQHNKNNGNSYCEKDCKDCRNKDERVRRKKARDLAKLNPTVVSKTKTCYGCNITKNTVEFNTWARTDGMLVPIKYCKSCESKQQKKRRQDPKNLAKKQAKYQKDKYENPKAMLLSSAKQRAKRKGREFNINIEDIHIPDMCPLLEIPLKINIGRPKADSPSLDRIDTEKGYTPDNIWVISHRANSAKWDFTKEELKIFCDNIKGKIL